MHTLTRAAISGVLLAILATLAGPGVAEAKDFPFSFRMLQANGLGYYYYPVFTIYADGTYANSIGPGGTWAFFRGGAPHHPFPGGGPGIELRSVDGTVYSIDREAGRRCLYGEVTVGSWYWLEACYD